MKLQVIVIHWAFKSPCSMFMALCVGFVCFGVVADEKTDSELAINRGLSLIQKAARTYPSHRQCFSCHHQTLPLLAIYEAKQAGFEIHDEVAEIITEHTLESFHSRINKLNDGRRIGGAANTVSYGLWTLALAQHESDETTSAMVQFLLKTQREEGHWVPPSNRPPLEESRISVTVLSAYYMSQFAEDNQRDNVAKSIAKAQHWLASAETKSQEDLNFQLWSSVLLEQDNNSEDRQRPSELRQQIIGSQREDGGWAQNDAMESDAYATGQTLFVLMEAGEVDAPVVESALNFLRKSQGDDGSWFVETRSKPVQIFFDNGDPHGKSQFISVAATSWAVAAIAKAKRLLD